MAELPDATVRIELRSGSCKHPIVGDLELPVVEELRTWLLARVEAAGILFDSFEQVLLSLHYKTDRVPTDRKRILLFELECACEISLDNRVIEGHATNALWYERRTSPLEPRAAGGS